MNKQYILFVVFHKCIQKFCSVNVSNECLVSPNQLVYLTTDGVNVQCIYTSYTGLQRDEKALNMFLSVKLTNY